MPERQPQTIFIATTVSIISFACGLIIGLPILGWWIWPVEWTNIPITPLSTYTPYPTYTSYPTHTMFPANEPTHILETPTFTPTLSSTSIFTPTATEISSCNCQFGCTFHASGADIKGNISFTTREKIYHVPSGEFYNDTNIDPDFGERWFCTEAEAIANGWRKSQR